MFMFKASVFLQELKTFEPEILDICGKAIQNSNKDLDFIRIDSELFSKCKSESIDYAIMEKLIKQLLFLWMRNGMMLVRGLHFGT